MLLLGLQLFSRDKTDRCMQWFIQNGSEKMAKPIQKLPPGILKYQLQKPNFKQCVRQEGLRKNRSRIGLPSILPVQPSFAVVEACRRAPLLRCSPCGILSEL